MKVEDADYLKSLFVAAINGVDNQGLFIEAGYHLSASPRKMMAALSKQNEFLNDCRQVPILGVKEEVMERKVMIGNEVKTVRDHLKQQFKVVAVEKTAQSAHLGNGSF